MAVSVWHHEPLYRQALWVAVQELATSDGGGDEGLCGNDPEYEDYPAVKFERLLVH